MELKRQTFIGKGRATHSVIFGLKFLKLETLIGKNKKKKAMWAKLTGSRGSLLISPEKASEIITLPKVQT
jgi:hypothetical protein